LTVSLAALYIGGVVGLEAVFHAITGQRSELVIAAVTLAVAALFNPWRHQLQRFIDRRFYRHKYDAARVLSAFTTHLRDEVDLDELSDDLMTVVQETVQPATVSLWIKAVS
jgi:small basic protein